LGVLYSECRYSFPFSALLLFNYLSFLFPLLSLSPFLSRCRFIVTYSNSAGGALFSVLTTRQLPCPLICFICSTYTWQADRGSCGSSSSGRSCLIVAQVCFEQESADWSPLYCHGKCYESDDGTCLIASYVKRNGTFTGPPGCQEIGGKQKRGKGRLNTEYSNEKPFGEGASARRVLLGTHARYKLLGRASVTMHNAQPRCNTR
jgi:hypothetical protein